MQMQLQPHEIQQQVVGLGHSVGVILAVLSGSDTDATEHNTLQDKVDRNARHILTVCDYPHFADRDMSFYRNVAAQGQTWLQEYLT